MSRFKNPNAWTAAALFALSFVVYALTTSRTIAFWDAGEFVATAYGLGIPHQPGTPLYVLVGRVFSLLPLGLPVAMKINLMSSFFGALAVSLVYLTAVRLQTGWAEERESPTPVWLVRAGAAAGAIFLALSHTFWINATEAEVYALASFVLALTGYMMVRWYEERGAPSSSVMLLLAIYVMGLSVGFHLGSILVYPGLFVLALICRDKALDDIDLLIVSAAMATFVLSTMMKDDMLFVVLYVLCGALAVWRLVVPNGSAFALIGIGLFFLGLSVHLFMLIRTTQDPFINQSVPDTFQRLMMVIRREQYPPRSIFHREAPLLWQVGHFLGTSVWKEGTSLAGSRTIGFLQQFTFLPRPGFVDSFVVIALGLYGMVSQWRGDRRLFAGFLTILLINSVGLILVLNFTATEVRDRDYFYFGAFEFWALFMALGAGALLRTIWQGTREHALPVARAVAVALLVVALLPVLWPNHPKFYAHDRSEDVIARNYGWNMLAHLPEDTILFTNGDNDTFPLWYLQEVEGVRPDVRVVNLSLINVPWYIKQLRDIPPKLPIAWTDRQIEGRDPIVHQGVRTTLTPKIMPDDSILYVRDMAVWHIIEQNKWKRPIYFAVTIPPEYIQDYMPYLSMEGLVYRLTRTRSENDQPKVDPDAILTNFTQRYDMEKVWIPRVSEQPELEPRLGRPVPFVRDSTIYKDHNTRHLLRNYPAALCRAGYQYLLERKEEQALEVLELAFELDPTFGFLVDLLPSAYLQAGDLQKALETADYYMKVLDDPRQMAVDFARNLLIMGYKDQAYGFIQERIAEHPQESAYQRTYARLLWQDGRRPEAVARMRDWAQRSGDPEAAADLQAMEEILSEEPSAPDSLGGEEGP